MIPAMMIFVWLSKKKLWIISAILLVGIALPFAAPQVLRERVSYTFTQAQKRKDVVKIGGVKLDTSTSARLLSWRSASRDWIKHPFLGFGVTGYRFVDAQYVRVITETGLLGLATFFILLATIFRRSLEVFRESADPFSQGLSMGFLAGFTGLLFHSIGANTFIIVRIMEPFWFLAAMVVMLPELAEEH
jgi:O-antigen ligase